MLAAVCHPPQPSRPRQLEQQNHADQPRHLQPDPPRPGQRLLEDILQTRERLMRRPYPDRVRDDSRGEEPGYDGASRPQIERIAAGVACSRAPRPPRLNSSDHTGACVEVAAESRPSSVAGGASSMYSATIARHGPCAPSVANKPVSPKVIRER